MTLLERNHAFKVEIIGASVFLSFMVFVSFFVIALYPAVVGQALVRSAGMLITQFVPVQVYVPFVSMMCMALYACAGIVCIYLYFEKTESPEIFFFSFFVLSTAFESLRVMALLKTQYNLPSLYLGIAFRVLIFSRYFGIFSLFAAGVRAAGMEVKNMLFVIIVVALAIAVRVPVDSLSWDSSLGPINGVTATFVIIEFGCILITVISFLISAYTRGEKEYLFIGSGALLVFLGKKILQNADIWVVLCLGMVLLITGTWFICTRLHRVYLWL
jgi:hypothetical protein